MVVVVVVATWGAGREARFPLGIRGGVEREEKRGMWGEKVGVKWVWGAGDVEAGTPQASHHTFSEWRFHFEASILRRDGL